MLLDKGGCVNFIGASSIVFVIILILSLGYFLKRVSERLSLKNFKLGSLDIGNPWVRFKRVFLEVVLQYKVIKNRPFVGVMHALVMWGFVSFGLISLGHFWVGLNNFTVTNPLVHGWYGTFVAIWAVLVLFGILSLVYRRFIIQPKELGKLSVTSGQIALFICLLMVTYLLDWRFLQEYSLSWKINWWIHTVSLLAIFWIIPNSKHLHLLLAPFSIFLRSDTTSTMRALDLEHEDMGLINFQQLPWKDILDVNSCVECGRCTMVCPANLVGQTLNPKSIILEMQEGFLSKGQLIAGTQEEKESGKAWVSETDLFQCLSCGACEEVCPVGIEHVGRKILDLRRGLVNEGRTDNESVSKLFSVMERAPHNPWGIGSEVRKKFITRENFPIFDGSQEWLFWLGCGNSYDFHGQEVARAMKKIFDASGVSWGVLENEVCCGEPARRAGNELIYLTLSEKVTELFKNHNVKKIITCCPHCTTMFDKDYRQLPDYNKLGINAYHHSEFIQSVLPKLFLVKNPKTVTYHDPCYLARGRKIIDQPRNILKSCGFEIKEMEHCKSETFCCGAGGAQLFIADDSQNRDKSRVNQMRFKEVESTGVETLTVACPYCPIMLKDAANHANSNLEILDIAEVVARQITQKGEAVKTTETETIVRDGVKYHFHPNGGGLVAETAYVAPTVHVALLAEVSGQACLEGDVQVTGRARVGGTVKASGHVVFAGKSNTTEGTFEGGHIIYE